MSENKIIRMLSLWLDYIASYGKVKDKHIWVFGEWFGQRSGDNCTYFANYVAQRSSNIEIYWICNKNTNTDILDKKIKILERGSREAEGILNKAGAIFMNQNFLDVSLTPFNKYGRSLSVNFWHGFPWKKIGHDADKRSSFLFRLYCKTIDPVQKAKKYITLSDEYSQKMESAFGIKSKQFIKAGYPRNYGLYSKAFQRESKKIVIESIQNANSCSINDDVRFIAYMPTFRDSGDKPIDLRTAFDEKFYRWLSDNKIFILQKAHFVDSDNENKTPLINNNVINVNQLNAATLMAASDVLITDYSSCMFDYLILDRPIIQFVYDYENYKNKDRGLFFDLNDIKCGKVSYNSKELQDAIINSLELEKEYSVLRQERLVNLMTYESSDSCEIIFQNVCQSLGIKGYD